MPPTVSEPIDSCVSHEATWTGPHTPPWRYTRLQSLEQKADSGYAELERTRSRVQRTVSVGQEPGRHGRDFGSPSALISASTTSASGREASISIVADFLSNGSTVAL